MRSKSRLSANAYIEGILSGDRMLLSRAITLVESRLDTDQELAGEVLQSVLPHTGKSLRIGITGVPGVGKSTFIEAFGNYITTLTKKVAVLAVDPSSERSRGSILGDKTRMETLVNNPQAYVRPSPTSSSLGGVTRSTRQAMLLCEAAGYEVIIIETVGVGQSETIVHEMTDFFLLLMLAGAGDELQGIKRGIMEMADAIAITKSDGDNRHAAQLAQVAYQNALHLLPPPEAGWIAPVLTCSAVTHAGIAEIWQVIEQYRQLTQAKGFFEQNRQQQNLRWMQEAISQALEDYFYKHPRIQKELSGIKEAVSQGKLPATQAAQQLLRWWNGEQN
jgi:LAO/AO transport system kinase